MTTIKFSVEHPEKLLGDLHLQLKSKLEGNLLAIDEEDGIGAVKLYSIQKGIYAASIDVTYKNPIKSIRIASEQNDYFILNFHLVNTGSHIQKGEQSKVLNTEYNVVLESAMMETEVVLEADTPIQVFIIVLSKDWIKDNILNPNSTENTYIRQVFLSDKPIYLLDTINYKLSNPIKSILNRGDTYGIETFSDVLLILKHFFEKIKQRNKPTEFLDISRTKLKLILDSKQKIESKWKETISINCLSKEVGMSISSYRRTFKQVLGTTPYQYFLNYKMYRALKLLESKKYSVSEVGYMVGYSNLGQFSKIFKRVHTYAPNEVK